MPQARSSALMVSVGQLQALRAFAASQPFEELSAQKIISYLLKRQRPFFQLSPEVEHAIGLMDWLSTNREFALTVKEELLSRIDNESETTKRMAWDFYVKSGGKRKALPNFYRRGFFLVTLIGEDCLSKWARSHQRFADYQMTRQAFQMDPIQPHQPMQTFEVKG